MGSEQERKELVEWLNRLKNFMETVNRHQNQADKILHECNNFISNRIDTGLTEIVNNCETEKSENHD